MAVNPKEIYSKVRPLKKSQEPAEVLPDMLEVAVKTQEYRTKLDASEFTPDFVDQFFQALWKTWGEKVNHVFEVPTCDRTREELAALYKEGKGVLLIPHEAYTPEGMILLERIFPQMGNWHAQSGTTIKNVINNNGGCIDIEMGIDVPNVNTSEKQLKMLFALQGREGERLVTYIVGSQVSRLLTGRFFDQGHTWSRLLGSHSEDRTISVYFSDDGGLHFVSGWLPQHHYRRMGGRSEGMKKN